MNQHFEGTIVFMTDPLCSWCWAMRPEIEKLQDALGQRLVFEFKCAGLQVGSEEPLSEAQAARLISLWQEVTRTTGQQFAFSLPRDSTFIYHSELACRALQIARLHLDKEPWDLLWKLQEAFYLHCANIADLDTLHKLISTDGIKHEAFLPRMLEPHTIEKTRQEFDWCKARGIQALPTLFLDLGEGPTLISGGYATAEFLIPEISARLSTH
jgi:putative protein-disulfide isomerase